MTGTGILKENRTAICIIMLTLALAGCASGTVCPAAGLEGRKKDMLAYINNTRAEGRQCGGEYYPPASYVVWNDLLAGAAIKHSEDMAESGFYDHIGSDGSDHSERITDAGYNWKACGENIHMGVNSSREAVESWLKSPEHCANIMRSVFTEMGAGAVRGKCSDCGYCHVLFWTLNLAKPLSCTERK